MLDTDLAEIYGVRTARSNEQIRRNAERFPEDFMLRLTNQELAILRSQLAISSSQAWGGRRYRPYVFTEHGALMAANVLNSPPAVEANVDAVGRLRVAASMLPTLAQTLGTSIKELIGQSPARGNGERGPALRLPHQMERLSALPKPKRPAGMEVLESMLAQAAREEARI